MSDAGDDEPVVDLMDRRGRLVRFAIAAAAAVAAVIVVASATYAWVDPEHQASTGGWKFVFYMSFLAGGLAFGMVMAVLEWRAKRIEEANRIPKARVV